MPDLSVWGQFGKLRDDVDYGKHILLTCKNHPDLRWTTKNIAPIGSRNIFFEGSVTGKSENECTCSCGDLVVLQPKAKD